MTVVLATSRSSGGSGTVPSSPLEAILPRLREAGTHTLIYGLGSALQAALGFILIPLYTRYFDPRTYGVFALLTVAGTFGAVGFTLGAPSALGRSYFDYHDEADRRRVVATSIYVLLAGGLMAMAVGVLLGDVLSLGLIGSAEYGPHFRLVLAMSVLAQWNGLLLVVARFQRRSVLVVGTNLAALAGTSLLIYYLIAVPKLGLMAPILGMLLSQGAQVAWLSWALRRQIALVVMRREIAVQLAYGLPAVVASLLFLAIDSIGRVFLNRMADTAAVGLYSLGNRIGFVVNVLLVLPFAQIWTPMRMEYRGDSNAPHLFAVVLRYFVLAGLALTLVIGTFAPELIQLISGRPEYQDAYRVISLVMLGYLAWGTIGVVDAGIIFERRIGVHAQILAVALALNVLFNWLLIPRYGIVGAGWATLVTYSFAALAAGIVANSLYHVPWELRRIATCLGLGVAGLLVSALLPAGSLQVVLAKVCVLAVVGVGWWFAGLTREERSAIHSLLRSKLRAARTVPGGRIRWKGYSS